MAADAAGSDEAAGCDEASRWISVDGSPPAACQPNSLAWSADNLLAVAAGGGVVVLDPTLPSVRHSVPLAAWGLPLSVRALCWSPPLCLGGRTECLLCVACSQLCLVFARPASPFESVWRCVANLSAALPAAAGLPLVHCCCWAPLLAPSASLLALGGPNTLALLHAAPAEWRHAARLACPAGGVASVRLSRDEARLRLLCGVLGAVLLFHVDLSAGEATPAARVSCAARSPVYSIAARGEHIAAGCGARALLFPPRGEPIAAEYALPVSGVVLAKHFWLAASADGSVDAAPRLADGRWGPIARLDLPGSASAKQAREGDGQGGSGTESDEAGGSTDQVFGVAASPCDTIVCLLLRVKQQAQRPPIWRVAFTSPCCTSLTVASRLEQSLASVAEWRTDCVSAWPLGLCCRLFSLAQAHFEQLEARVAAQVEKDSLPDGVRRVRLLRALANEALGREWSSEQWAAAPPSGGLPELSRRCAAWLRARHASLLLQQHAAEGGAWRLRAADCLVAAAGGALPAEGLLRPPALSLASAAAARGVYREALCAAGEAALDAIQGRASPPPPPPRDPCAICSAKVRFASDGGWHECTNGHRMQRCWRCLCVLTVSAWTCGTCGAGACRGESSCALPPGAHLLDAEPGTCGLCGSPCIGASIAGV